MFLATTNKTKRLLHVGYIGHVRAEELTHGLEDLRMLLADLPSNFRVLVDFGRLEEMDADATTVLGQLMETIAKGGAELVVRVIPDPSKDPGVKILALFHYRKGVRTVTCQTMEEAAKKLGI
jgi:anti-anti-sigma regulatory factor